MTILEQVLLWAHGLSGAAWFGAIFYRTATVDRKVKSYCPEPAEYERLSIHLAHNMRYMVWGGILTCGLSGFALVGLRWQPENEAWLGLMGAKVVVWLAAVGLFCYVSYRHWPWRALAAPTESDRYRAEAQRLAWLMVALSAMGFLLGQACRLAWGPSGGLAA